MVLCAPCLLPLISGAGAIGSGGATIFNMTRKTRIMLILLAFIFLVSFLLFWRISKQCDTCQLQLPQDKKS